MAVRKKKKVVARRSGVTGAPFAKGLDAVHSFFHTEVERKDLISSFKSYAKTQLSKEQMKYLNAVPDYKFTMATWHCATAAFLINSNESNERVDYWKGKLHDYIQQLITIGKELWFEKESQRKDSDRIVSLSPMQRLQNKISNTIMQDLLDLEDSWMEGEKTSLDIYALFKKHGLGASATKPVRAVIEGWLLDYSDAYNKSCPDAVEGYSFLKRPELNRRLKVCESMIADLDRITSAAKATRKTKVKAPKTADRQVRHVKYKTQDNDFKLVSIPPIQIVGKIRLYVFNTKTKQITEYLTQSAQGFEISGSTIKNFDGVNSRIVKLRKPDEFLGIVLKKTPNQIGKAWSELTTKSSIPNGRINKDTIILKAFDK